MSKTGSESSPKTLPQSLVSGEKSAGEERGEVALGDGGVASSATTLEGS